MNEVALIKAYLSAKYIVLLNEKAERIKVGQSNIATDELLRNLPVKSAYFITPENPFSISLCDEENMLRHQRFINELKLGNYLFYEGYGTDEEETWSKEKSYLIITDNNEGMLKLAGHFGQKGILKLDYQLPVSLLLLEPMQYVEHIVAQS